MLPIDLLELALYQSDCEVIFEGSVVVASKRDSQPQKRMFLVLDRCNVDEWVLRSICAVAIAAVATTRRRFMRKSVGTHKDVMTEATQWEANCKQRHKERDSACSNKQCDGISVLKWGTGLASSIT